MMLVKKVVLEHLRSLLYKCQLYGKFFERRYAQHNQKLLLAEHRHINRLEKLQRKRALSEVSYSLVVHGVEQMSTSVFGLNFTDIIVLDPQKMSFFSILWYSSTS